MSVFGNKMGERRPDRPSFPVCPCTTLRSAHSQTRCSVQVRSVLPLHERLPYLFTVLVLVVNPGQRDEPERVSAPRGGRRECTHFECALSRGSVERTLGTDMV